MLINKETQETVSRHYLKKALNKSFPTIITADHLAGTDYTTAQMTNPPSVNEFQRALPDGFEQIDSVWCQKWRVDNFTAKERKSRLIDYAYKQSVRREAPITMTLSGKECVFTPDEKFNERLGWKIQAMTKRGQGTTKWIFDSVDGDITDTTHRITLEELESMGLASDRQWQAYFNVINDIIKKIRNTKITTRKKINDLFDQEYAQQS